MSVFDFAKAAVSVAEYALNASQIVLYLAEGGLKVAKLGLDTASMSLVTEKSAIDFIKYLLDNALYVFEQIVRYGLQSLIAVRNCRFEVQLSAIDRTFLMSSVRQKHLGLVGTHLILNSTLKIQL